MNEMEEKYYHTKASVEEYIKHAKGFDGLDHIEVLRQYLEKSASILELGSGPGTDFEILSKDYQITGSDYSEEFIDHLKSKFPNSEFLKLNASLLATELTFDGIYSNKVLHHLTDEELESSIKNQARILNNNGLICHSFWKGKGSEVFKGMFVNYHEKESLMRSFSPHFEIINLEEYKEFDENDSIRLIARKK